MLYADHLKPCELRLANRMDALLAERDGFLKEMAATFAQFGQGFVAGITGPAPTLSHTRFGELQRFLFRDAAVLTFTEPRPPVTTPPPEPVPAPATAATEATQTTAGDTIPPSDVPADGATVEASQGLPQSDATQQQNFTSTAAPEVTEGTEPTNDGDESE